MDRADARRGARAERVNAAQSPYGSKQSSRRKPKVEKGGLWSFIKSWSFFTPDQDSNMAGDSDSDDDMPDQLAAKYYPKTPMKYSAPPIIKTSDDESGSSHVASGSSVASYDDDLRRYKVPGDIWRLPTPAPIPKPIAPPLAKITRIGGKSQVKSVMAPPPLPVPESSESQSQSLNLGSVRELVSAQVARFLLTKAGKPLTSEEFEQIDKILRLAVDKNAPEGDISILESDPLLNQALEAVESAKKDQPTETPYMGTVVTRVPQDEDDLLDEDINGSKHSSDSNQKVSDSGSDHYSSPSVTTNGLPRFPQDDDEEDTSPPEPEPQQAEIDEAERLRCILEAKTEELRRYLKLDEDDEEEAEAWDELERWKGLKSPTPSAAGSVSEAATSVTSTSGTSRAEEEEQEPVKVLEELVDYNKGYTPAELMINPYDRISAFRNRKTRRKLVSKEDLAALRKKRAAAKEEAAKLEMARAELEKEDAEREAAQAAAERRVREEEAMAYPPIPRRQEEIHMGILDAGVLPAEPMIVLRPYDLEPTQEPPKSGDWRMTGTTKDGRTWNNVLKRKAVSLLLGSNGELLDPPTEGPPIKRRRSSSPEEDPENDKHMENLILVTGDTPLVEEHDDDDEEMIDETPEPPPPPIVLTRASPSRKRPRPKIRPVPDSTRPKHFQYSPITPSPLRLVSAFDSPKQASVEIPPEAVPQKKEAPVKEEESYAFDPFAYRLGSIGPTRTSRELIQRASDFSPYHLPEYTMGGGKYKARYGRGFKRRTPKIFRRTRQAKVVEKAQNGKLEHVSTNSKSAAAPPTQAEDKEVQIVEPPKSSSADPQPDMLTMSLEEEPRPTTTLTNGISKPAKISTTPPVQVNALPAMVPELRLGSKSSKRKPTVTTSTPSSDPLIHSRSGATISMADDIPPLRLPEQLPEPVPEPVVKRHPGVPPPKTRGPRLREGPSASTRLTDWASAGTNNIARDASASSGFEWSTGSDIGKWNCGECRFVNDVNEDICSACNAGRGATTPVVGGTAIAV